MDHGFWAMLFYFSIGMFTMSFSISCIMFPYLGIWYLGKRIKVVIIKHSKSQHKLYSGTAGISHFREKDIGKFRWWKMKLHLFRLSHYC